MDAFIFQFDAKQLRAIPRDYLGFFVASAHCCNEVAILLPYIIFEHDLRQANDFESAFIVTRKFTIDRILILKLFEYWKLCSNFFKIRSADPFISRLAEEFAPIDAKIKNARWAAVLRNKVSFHYDSKHALTSLDQLGDNHVLRLMAGQLKGPLFLNLLRRLLAGPSLRSPGTAI